MHVSQDRCTGFNSPKLGPAELSISEEEKVTLQYSGLGDAPKPGQQTQPHTSRQMNGGAMMGIYARTGTI